MADAVPPPSPASAPDRSRLVQILATLGVMLAVGVILFFVGVMQGKKPVPRLRDQVALAQARLASSQDEARLHKALALTYRSALDLDERNFGTANDHLQLAARALDGLSETDGTGVDELRRLMAETNINVAEDLEGQRARVVSYAQELSDLIAQAEAEPEAQPVE
ncbi:MAG: hypothetical protein HKN04_08420 [Rhodothermaceae bacterium]|nr:hypothetical protein [Rhodothermaceae bacterium]